jgi:hypothetical protein
MDGNGVVVVEVVEVMVEAIKKLERSINGVLV